MNGAGSATREAPPAPRPRMNIAASCNEGYAPLVYVNLINIHEILGAAYDVHFYLIQSQITAKSIAGLESFAADLDLTFHNIAVTDDGFIKTIATHARAPHRERFYDGACHLFLPDDLDRVLFIDVGDFLFTSADYPFYFEDFQGKSLLVSSYWDLKEDRLAFDQFYTLWGGFNSGHMLVNLEKLRRDKLGPEDFVSYVEAWSAHYNGKRPLFGGDQAFLTAFFAGDIATIAPENPYNVKVVAFNGDQPDFAPKSIHLNAMFGSVKPWEVPFKTRAELDKLKIVVKDPWLFGGRERVYFAGYENDCIEAWWAYCQRTPVHDAVKGASLSNMRLTFAMARHLREAAEKGAVWRRLTAGGSGAQRAASWRQMRRHLQGAILRRLGLGLGETKRARSTPRDRRPTG